MSEEPILGKPPLAEGEVAAHGSGIDVICWKCGATNHLADGFQICVCWQCKAIIKVGEI